MKIKLIFKFSILLSIVLLVLNKGASKLKKRSRNMTSALDKYTRYTEVSSNSTRDFDRHDINCEEDEALQGFQLFLDQNEHNETSGFYYKFKCLASAALENEVLQNQTGWINNTNTYPWLNLHPQCPKGYGLQQFKLMFNQDTSSIGYRCVKAHLDSCHQGQAIIQPSKLGVDLHALNKLYIRIGHNSILTGFTFVLNNSKSSSPSISYIYEYCDFSDIVKIKTLESDEAKSKLEKLKNSKDKAILDHETAKNNSIAAAKICNKTQIEETLAREKEENITIQHQSAVNTYDLKNKELELARTKSQKAEEKNIKLLSHLRGSWISNYLINSCYVIFLIIFL